MVCCRKNWPEETIPPNLHMLEDHTGQLNATSHDTPAEYAKKEHYSYSQMQGI